MCVCFISRGRDHTPRGPWTDCDNMSGNTPSSRRHHKVQLEEKAPNVGSFMGRSPFKFRGGFCRYVYGQRWNYLTSTECTAKTQNCTRVPFENVAIVE